MAMTRLSSMWLPPLSWAVLSPENENSDERQVHIKKDIVKTRRFSLQILV